MSASAAYTFSDALSTRRPARTALRLHQRASSSAPVSDSVPTKRAYTSTITRMTSIRMNESAAAVG